MNQIKRLSGTEDITLAVARVTGGHYFDPGTRRFFAARITKAHEAPDGIVYVMHSKQFRYHKTVGAREYMVTAFRQGDEDEITHLVEGVSYKVASAVYKRTMAMGCSGFDTRMLSPNA